MVALNKIGWAQVAPAGREPDVVERQTAEYDRYAFEAKEDHKNEEQNFKEGTFGSLKYIEAHLAGAHYVMHEGVVPEPARAGEEGQNYFAQLFDRISFIFKSRLLRQ